MTNSYDNSWHDSDDIDSETEQEAYDLLYNIDFTSTEKQNNQSSYDENQYMEISFPDTEDSANNLEASSIIENDNYSDSDCEIQNVQTIRCSNAVNALCIALSSDESECDAIQGSMNKATSFMINVTSANNIINIGNNLQNKSFNEITNDKQWSVDYKPIQKSKFSNRYFESNSKSVCIICLKKGHSELECSKSGPVCILCGKEGHLSKKCDTIVCCVCFQVGHGPKACQFTPKFLRSSCKRCGQRGHYEEICPDTWRQYKYTTVPGPPVIKKCSSQTKVSVICANCAKPGHFTEQCPRSRMNSRFLGPPPVMEIIRFENRDIYDEARITYSRTLMPQCDQDTSENEQNLDFPSFIDNIDVSMIINDFEFENEHDVIGDSSSSSVHIDQSTGHLDSKATEPIYISQNGNISLNVVMSKQSRQNHTVTEDIKAIGSSTPRTDKARKSIEKFPKKSPTILPGITTELLKKLFPEETNGHEKLPPSLRKSLRKKLKNLIEHGYLPGDTNMTQERMEFWLQEISTGRALNYREKKKLLSSVSAALHSISDRVSAVDISDYETPSALKVTETETDPGLSVPESRRRRNRLSRQQKNLRNELKLSRREKRLGKNDSVIRDRLRNGVSSRSELLENIQSGTPDSVVMRTSKKYKPKKRRSKPVDEFQVLNQSQ